MPSRQADAGGFDSAADDGETVLVVDDESDLRTLIVEQMQELGDLGAGSSIKP